MVDAARYRWTAVGGLVVLVIAGLLVRSSVTPSQTQEPDPRQAMAVERITQLVNTVVDNSSRPERINVEQGLRLSGTMNGSDRLYGSRWQQDGTTLWMGVLFDAGTDIADTRVFMRSQYGGDRNVSEILDVVDEHLVMPFDATDMTCSDRDSGYWCESYVRNQSIEYGVQTVVAAGGVSVFGCIRTPQSPLYGSGSCSSGGGS